MNQESVIPKQLQEGLDLIKQEEPSSWLDLSDWRYKAFLILLASLFVLWVIKRLRRAIRRRRPPKLHPKLQKYGANYGEPTPAMLAQRRKEAAKILATSSTSTIAGYEVTEQIETIFVDGFRRPEDSLEGLKAAAAMKGANAVTNVNHERNDSDKLSVSGDAVIVRRLVPNAPPDAEPDPPPDPLPHAALDDVPETIDPSDPPPP